MKHFSLYRIYRIVWMAIRFFLQVTYFKRTNRGEWTKDKEEKWNELVKKQAQQYKRTALALGGLLIKLGQFLSTRADMMPRTFIQELEDLTDHVPPVGWKETKKVIETEWEGDYTTILTEISDEPVASASIGEVYQARLHTGELVAVKIRRPGIEQIIQTDFKAIRFVMWLANRFTKMGKQTDLPALYREIKRVINSELNFRKEMQNGQAFRRRFEKDPSVEIPDYYEELSTRRVLVMDWKEGKKITDTAYLDKHQLNRKEVADLLLRLFLQQLLEDGIFHADPHGGNILVKQDGTIVLLDFGMIGTIQEADRKSVQKAVEGVVMERYDLVVDALEDLRFLLPHADRSILQEMIRHIVEEYQEMNFAHADSRMVEQLMEDIIHVVQKEPLQMPSEFAFFGKAVSTLIGVIYVIEPEADLFNMVKPVISQWVTTGTEDKDKLNWQGVVVKAGKAFVRLPYKLDDLLEEPRRERQRKQADAEKKRIHETMLSKKRDALIFFLIPFTFLHVGLFFEKWLVMYWFGGISLFTFLNYLRASHKVKKEE
ncbi:AarF/UbiB family protein [Bacillus tianshenii]|nr:AarF/UbiB family protein [Bacillus tianshenii]